MPDLAHDVPGGRWVSVHQIDDRLANGWKRAGREIRGLILMTPPPAPKPKPAPPEPKPAPKKKAPAKKAAAPKKKPAPKKTTKKR